VFIEVPRDQFDVRPEQVWRHEHRPSSPSAPAGLDAAVEDLVATVDAAERPVIWSGVRVLRRGCGHQVIELAERIGAPIVESVMGKGSVPEEHPLVLGVYSGLTTSHESVKDLVEDSDCVIELGIERNDINCGAFSVEIPLERSVELASDVRIGHRVYAGIPMITALEGLIAAGPRERAAPDDLPHSWATTPADASGPLTTDQITETLEQFLEPDDILTVDVGAVAHLTIDIRLAAAGQLHINRYYVGMGFAVPASTGAALARGAGRPVVLVGDGSFQMTGFDLSTAIRYGVRPIVLVLDNAGLTTERAIADGPFNDIAEWDYAAVGDVVGASGVEVATQADLHAALTRARAEEDRAWIISMKVDQHDYPRPLRELGKGLAELMHDSQGT
jgi:indolepyruvate decarboxylase